MSLGIRGLMGATLGSVISLGMVKLKTKFKSSMSLKVLVTSKLE